MILPPVELKPYGAKQAVDHCQEHIVGKMLEQNIILSIRQENLSLNLRLSGV